MTAQPAAAKHPGSLVEPQPDTIPLPGGWGTPQHPRIYFSVDDMTVATTRVREFGRTAGEPVTIASGAVRALHR